MPGYGPGRSRSSWRQRCGSPAGGHVTGSRNARRRSTRPSSRQASARPDRYVMPASTRPGRHGSSAGTRSCNPSRNNRRIAARSRAKAKKDTASAHVPLQAAKQPGPAKRDTSDHATLRGGAQAGHRRRLLHLHRGSRGAILWADITSFVLVVAGGQWLHLRVMLSRQITVPPAVVSVLGLLALLVLYAIWTATPPDLPVFQPG